DSKRRLQHIGDARLELDEIGNEDTSRASKETAPRRLWPLIAAAIAGVALAGIGSMAMRPTPIDRPLSRVSISIPSSAPLLPGRFTGRGGGLALSPDGRTIVYATSRGPLVGLVTRELDALSVEPLRGAEGGTWPFFSPDGQWIGFFADGKMKKLPGRGGLAGAGWCGP